MRRDIERLRREIKRYRRQVRESKILVLTEDEEGHLYWEKDSKKIMLKPEEYETLKEQYSRIYIIKMV